MIDEKTIELMNQIIKEVAAKNPEVKPVILTDEEIDKIAGPPLSLEEHRNFYRMYMAILKANKEQIELRDAKSLRNYKNARLELRQPSGLLGLIELVETLCYQKILTPLAENVQIRAGLQAKYQGRKPKKNPFKEDFVAFVAANPSMTLLEVIRARDKWLDREHGDYDNEQKEFFLYNHKEQKKPVKESTLREWLTIGRKRAKDSVDT